jgi:hypothetical protein
MRRRQTMRLAVPQPFQVPASHLESRDELVEVLATVAALQELCKPEEGAMVVGSFADWLVAADPLATRIVYDVELATATGFAAHRFEALVGRGGGRDEIDRSTFEVLAWAAMEQAGTAPERHGPWIAYGIQVGYFVARRGRAGIGEVQEILQDWVRARVPTTHTAFWEGRLIADFGLTSTRRVVGYSYLPLRPVGIERMHDELLLQVAYDDYSERFTGQRPTGTPRMPAVFPIGWAPSL